MRHIVNLLAQSEIKVARHYFKKGAYVAAINRAQTTLNDYQNIAAVEDALIILIDSYNALGLTKLKDDTVRVLESSYPQSRYFSRAKPARFHRLVLRVGISFGDGSEGLVASSGKV
jgi:outer membrane protein assembly factor BamD